MATPRDPHDAEPQPTPAEPGPAAVPALEQEVEARVSQLLAEAGGPERMPAAVQARMEATIADLTTAPAPDRPTDLAARRRRRVVGGLLIAAAAVVVVGIGVQRSGDTAADEMMGAAEGEPSRGALAEDADAAERAEEGAGAGLDEDGSGAASAPGEGALSRMQGEHDLTKGLDGARAGGPTDLSDVTLTVVDEPLTRLHARDLREDLLELQSAALPHPATADYDRTTLRAPQGFSCANVAPGRGVLVAARYRGAPAVVAFREPVGESQVADVLQCGSGDLLRSITIPAVR